jgi:SAM-dependent methyltransferase
VWLPRCASGPTPKSLAFHTGRLWWGIVARLKYDECQMSFGAKKVTGVERMTDAFETTANVKTAVGYHTKERRDVLPFIPRSCRTLLDVGCGAAEFGALVKQEIGAEVWGVEIDAKVAAIAATKIDRVISSYFSPNADVPDNYFDVVTFNDVLEHFPDPYPPLELCKRKLKSGGVLVCSLPNVRYVENLRHLLVDMDWKYDEWGVRDRTHLRFFTRRSMLRTLDEAGYDVISIEGINASPDYWQNKTLFLLRLIFRKWMKDIPYLQFVIVATPKL